MACAELLPLCGVPTIVNREGGTGAYAYANIIGIGPYYFNGQQVSDPSSQKPQDQSRTVTGLVKPNTFDKGLYGVNYAACPV